jgi:hypothetical protein
VTLVAGKFLSPVGQFQEPPASELDQSSGGCPGGLRARRSATRLRSRSAASRGNPSGRRATHLRSSPRQWPPAGRTRTCARRIRRRR